MNHVPIAKGLLAATLMLASAAGAHANTASANPAGGTTNLEGTIDFIDLGLAQVSVSSVLFATDSNTRLDDFNGDPIAITDLLVGELVRVKYFPLTGPPLLADRISQLTGTPLDPPDVLSLDVPFGMEAQPVVRIYGDDAGDSLGGYTHDGLAFGDLNGDGFDDLVVGVRGADHPAGAAGGEVYIIYGGASVAGTVFDLNTDGAISPLGETRVSPADWGGLLGTTVACGDVDGDGIDDLIAGAPSANGGGEVVVVYGSSSLPGTLVDLGAPGDATRFLADELQEDFGAALATGDVNADGICDILVGAPGRTPLASHNGGRVYVIYGDPALRGATVDFDTDETISPIGETRIFGEKWEDLAGSSVACGDVNGDGYDDVIIGASRANVLLTADRGAGYIVYGSADLAGQIVDFSSTPDVVGPAGETRIFGRFANSWLGTDAACGDINGDGFDDVLFSAGGVTGPGDSSAVGEVYVLYGSPNLPGTILDLSNPQGTYGETWITGTEELAELGISIGSGDVDGDGLDDLLLGAPGSAMPAGPPTPGANDGLVFLFLGKPTLVGQQRIDPRQVADLMIVADDPDDRWGSSVVGGGDLDRNGIADHAAAAIGGDNPFLGGSDFTGYAVGMLGPAGPPSATRTEHSIAGDAPATDFGPVLRAVVDHAVGLAASTDTVVLTRSAPPSPPATSEFVLPAVWQVQSDRSAIDLTLSLTYTDTELDGHLERRLVVHQSADGVTAWTRSGSSQMLSAKRNQITVHGVDQLGFFCISVIRVKPELQPDPNPMRTP